MGYMRCPFCGQEIDSEAKKCFFCGSILSEISHHEESKQTPKQHDTSKKELSAGMNKITLILLLGAAFLGMAFLLISHFD
ncbi:MAG: hypothetical protein JXA96_04960 [Sedimentisphaerales bacterium]|nr:hypothetical protein [Sedimentisphaerales bacterium]